MGTFLFKLILGPLLIGVVSLAGRRWGAPVSGWLAGLPLTSGPVALFLALDQGPVFATASAQAIMLGIIPVGVFCLTYSWLARRWPWPPTLLGGWGVVVTATAVLNQWPVSLGPAFAAAVLMLGAVLRLLPPPGAAPPVTIPPRWEIPLRMAVAVGFVLGLTGLAQALGPRLSGLLAPLPIFATILAVFNHHFQGAGGAGRVLRGVVLGSFSFPGFFLVVAALLPVAGIPVAFLAASLVALAIQGLALPILQRGAPAPTEG